MPKVNNAKSHTRSPAMLGCNTAKPIESFWSEVMHGCREKGNEVMFVQNVVNTKRDEQKQKSTTRVSPEMRETTRDCVPGPSPASNVTGNTNPEWRAEWRKVTLSRRPSDQIRAKYPFLTYGCGSVGSKYTRLSLLWKGIREWRPLRRYR
jgi:hypothetical protein